MKAITEDEGYLTVHQALADMIAMNQDKLRELKARRETLLKPLDAEIAQVAEVIARAEATRELMRRGLEKKGKAAIIGPEQEEVAEHPVKKQASNKILDSVRKQMEYGNWESSETIARILILAGYPPKNCASYASKALKMLADAGELTRQATPRLCEGRNRGMRYFYRSVKSNTPFVNKLATTNGNGKKESKIGDGIIMAADPEESPEKRRERIEEARAAGLLK